MSKELRKRVRAIAISEDQRLFAVADEDLVVAIHELPSGKAIASFEHGGLDERAASLSFSPDSKSIGYGPQIGQAFFYNIHKKTQTIALGYEDRKGGTSSLLFSPDGKATALVNGFDVLTLYDLSDGRAIRKIGGRPGKGVVSVAYSPKGKLLATGTGSGTIHIWCAHSGAELALLRGHSDWVLSLCFVSENQLVSAGLDETVRVWQFTD